MEIFEQSDESESWDYSLAYKLYLSSQPEGETYKS